MTSHCDLGFRLMVLVAHVHAIKCLSFRMISFFVPLSFCTCSVLPHAFSVECLCALSPPLNAAMPEVFLAFVSPPHKFTGTGHYHNLAQQSVPQIIIISKLAWRNVKCYNMYVGHVPPLHKVVWKCEFLLHCCFFLWAGLGRSLMCSHCQLFIHSVSCSL